MNNNLNKTRIKIVIAILIFLIIVSIFSYNCYVNDKENKENKENKELLEIERIVNEKYKEQGFEYILKSKNENGVTFQKRNINTKKVELECIYELTNEMLNCYSLPISVKTGN